MSRMFRKIESYVFRLSAESTDNGILELFYRVFYLSAALILLLQLEYVRFFYGESRVSPEFPYDEGVLSFPFHLLRSIPEYAFACYSLVVIGCIYLLFKRSFIVALVIWVLYLNLYNIGYLTMNSGDMITGNIMLFLAILSYRPGSPSFRNLVLWLLRLQVIIIYLVSFLYKLEGSDWLKGEALYLISKNNVFGSSLLNGFPSGLLTFMTYMVLIHQMLFPILIWFRKLKLGVMILGMIIHLGVALYMGMPAFGWIMIIVYIPFVKSEDLKGTKIGNWFTRQTKAYRP